MSTLTMDQPTAPNQADRPAETTRFARAETATPAASATAMKWGAVATSTCAAMTVFMLSWVTIAMYLAVGNFVDALGVGAFCAVWGGPGFGAVATGVRYARHADQQPDH